MTERPLAVRLDEDTIARLDKLTEVLSVRAAGARVSRSDVVRSAIARGLDMLESETATSPKKRRPKR